MKKDKVQAFLDDFKNTSKIHILEEGAEYDELIKTAKKRGILLNNSLDLGVLKSVYCFADQANLNGAILEESELLEALPGIVGKPMNRNHIRNQIRGFYIDYKYEKSDKKVIAYAIFFKSAFKNEWEEAKDLLSKNKLAMSFEIWSSHHDGADDDECYYLRDMEIAGGGLLFDTPDDPNPPAFSDAKALALAKQWASTVGDKYLVCASEYENKEGIITSKTEKDNLDKHDNALEKSEVEGGQGMELNDLLQLIESKEEEKLLDSLSEFEGKDEELQQVVEKAKEAEMEEVVTKAEELMTSEEDPEKSEEEDPEESKSETVTEKNVTETRTSDEDEDGKFISEVEVDGDVVTIHYKDGEEISRSEYRIQETRIFTEAEIEEKDNEIAELKQKLENAQEEIKVIKAEYDSKLEDASEKLDEIKQNIDKEVEKKRTIAERKDELGEFAKELSDEDLLDDLKYENAQLKKRLDKLQNKDKEESKEEEDSESPDEAGLETGLQDEEADSEIKKIRESADKADEIADKYRNRDYN